MSVSRHYVKCRLQLGFPLKFLDCFILNLRHSLHRRDTVGWNSIGIFAYLWFVEHLLGQTTSLYQDRDSESSSMQITTEYLYILCLDLSSINLKCPFYRQCSLYGMSVVERFHCMSVMLIIFPKGSGRIETSPCDQYCIIYIREHSL